MSIQQLVEILFDFATPAFAALAIISGIQAIQAASDARVMFPSMSRPRRHLRLVRFTTSAAFAHVGLMVYWSVNDGVEQIGFVPTVAFESWHVLGASLVGGLMVHRCIDKDMTELVESGTRLNVEI